MLSQERYQGINDREVGGCGEEVFVFIFPREVKEDSYRLASHCHVTGAGFCGYWWVGCGYGCVARGCWFGGSCGCGVTAAGAAGIIIIGGVAISEHRKEGGNQIRVACNVGHVVGCTSQIGQDP